MRSDDTLPAQSDGTLPSEPTQAKVGHVLAGRYRLVSELGRGGQAVVFEARDLELERTVAVKALFPGTGSSDPGGWSNLLDEARMQADVETPGVARLLDALRDGGQRYLIMDMVRGPGLRTVIDRLSERSHAEGRRPAAGSWWIEACAQAAGTDEPNDRPARSQRWDRAVADFGARLSMAVNGLHRRGLVHCDLKPGNVKLDEQYDPMVLDFGLAGRTDCRDSGPLRGTPGYMAPEQLDERHQQRDPRTDVYQLGLILYELLTLQRAYPTDDVANLGELLQRVRIGYLTPVAEADPAADPGLAAVITRALAHSPDDRYPDLDTLVSDLRAIASGRAPSNVPTPLSYRARRHTEVTLRSRWFGVLATSLLLAVVAWNLRDRLVPELTSLNAWRYHPGAAELQAIAPSSPLQADDDLGVSVISNEPVWLYALSIFGDGEAGGRRVFPLYPLLFAEGRPIDREDPVWGLEVDAGEHDVLCARLDDPASREGLLVFAAPAEVPLLERWLVALDAHAQRAGAGVPHDAAFALLDTLSEPVVRRGSRIGAAGQNAAVDRYASLGSAQASGEEGWEFGQDLLRFEVLCEVLQQ